MTNIINTESVKATGIKPWLWTYSRKGNLVFSELHYNSKQEAVAAMKEFMSNLDMDNLPKAINLRLEITEPTQTAKRYAVVEVLDERDLPCCFEE